MEEGTLSGHELLAVREKQSEALHLSLGGYRIKEFLANPIGDEAFQHLVDAGARLRRTIPNTFEKITCSCQTPHSTALAGLADHRGWLSAAPRLYALPSAGDAGERAGSLQRHEW
jgi:hypothetical protein